jgi:hypothetical protein
LVSGMWRRCAKLTCGLSFEGICDAVNLAGPEPRAGKTREWMSAADQVDRYMPTRKATVADRTVCRMVRIEGLAFALSERI